MQTLAVDTFDAPVLSHIHQITLPTPFPVGPVHTYLVEGEPLTLIDTGPHTAEAWAALQAGLHILGYQPTDLERIVITHAHTDHFGLVGRLAEESRAEVWAARLAQPWIEGWPHFHDQRAGFWADLLAAAGVPAGRAEPTVQLYSDLRHLQTHAAVNHFLQDGATIDLAGLPWQALACPGHSSSLVCFYQADTRLLLGNDHLLAHISSNAVVEPPPEGELQRRKPLVDYWGSLCRIYDLPVMAVLAGHGPPVPNPRFLITQRFSYYEQRLARLREQLAEGPRTVWQLASGLFPHLDNLDAFLVTSEVLGHLDVLQEAGEATLHPGAPEVWSAVPAP
jgi:glyoxylase-like metal-dependent hydrolase (beta-lactamase superfamily II)